MWTGLYTKSYTSSCRRVKSESPNIDQSEGIFEQTVKIKTSGIYILRLHSVKWGCFVNIALEGVWNDTVAA
jgi:hypothetical protein